MMWLPCTSHFHLLLLLVFGFSFYCLFVISTQALCACSVSSSPFLVNFKHHLQGLKYELQHFESFSVEPVEKVLKLWSTI